MWARPKRWVGSTPRQEGKNKETIVKRDEDGLALSEDEEIAAAVEVVNRLIAERRLALTVRPAGEPDETARAVLHRMVAHLEPQGDARTPQPDTGDDHELLAGLLDAACQGATKAVTTTDIESRLGLVINLKVALCRAIEAARSSELRLQRLALVVVLHALENTYAEDLTQEQLNAVESALGSVSLTAFDRAQAAAISRELKAAGLSAVPALSLEQRQRLLDTLE